MNPLHQLNLYADEPTRVALVHLIKKKQAFEFEKKLAFYIRLAILLSSFVMLYIAGSMLNLNSFTNQFNVFQSTNFFAVFLIAVSLLTVYAVFNQFDKRVKKAEKEFQDMRKEIIAKSSELWSGPLWEKRNIVFEFFKKEYDINLYHESK